MLANYPKKLLHYLVSAMRTSVALRYDVKWVVEFSTTPLTAIKPAVMHENMSFRWTRRAVTTSQHAIRCFHPTIPANKFVRFRAKKHLYLQTKRGMVILPFLGCLKSRAMQPFSVSASE